MIHDLQSHQECHINKVLAEKTKYSIYSNFRTKAVAIAKLDFFSSQCN